MYRHTPRPWTSNSSPLLKAIPPIQSTSHGTDMLSFPSMAVGIGILPLDMVSFGGSPTTQKPWHSKLTLDLTISIPWNGDSPVAQLTDSKGYTFAVQAEDMSKCPGSCIRPVGLQFDWLGRMFVSSDATGEVRANALPPLFFYNDSDFYGSDFYRRRLQRSR